MSAAVLICGCVCGEAPVITALGHDGYRLDCLKCHRTTGSSTFEAAVGIWNEDIEKVRALIAAPPTGKMPGPSQIPSPPTHRHAKGGLYALVAEDIAGKGAQGGSWVPGVLYKGADGVVRWTSRTRWDRRFKELGR